MKLSLKSCGKTAESSGSFRIVLNYESDDGAVGSTLNAALTERTTGPVFSQFGPIVAELIEQLVQQLNEVLAAPSSASKAQADS